MAKKKGYRNKTRQKKVEKHSGKFENVYLDNYTKTEAKDTGLKSAEKVQIQKQ